MLEEKPFQPKKVAALEHHRAHYAAMRIEPIEFAAAVMPKDALAHALWFQVLKYIGRFYATAPGKGGLPDLAKAKDYLDRLIALEEGE